MAEEKNIMNSGTLEQRIKDPDDPAEGFMLGRFPVQVTQVREEGNTHRAALNLGSGFFFAAEGRDGPDAFETLKQRLEVARPKILEACGGVLWKDTLDQATVDNLKAEIARLRTRNK